MTTHEIAAAYLGLSIRDKHEIARLLGVDHGLPEMMRQFTLDEIVLRRVRNYNKVAHLERILRAWS